MGASGSFPVDLILFGMIAAFLVLRLRSILGRRTGFERQAPQYQPQPGPAHQRRPATCLSQPAQSDRRLRACDRLTRASIH
jgi:hypothetical protein